MSLETLLQDLQADPRFSPNFTAWRGIPPKPAQMAAYPSRLDPRLIETLKKRGIEGLYSHQTAAIEHVLFGENVVVVTPTASGKTM